MTILLVWILIVGEAGGHNSAQQFGPFAAEEDCTLVAASPALRLYSRQCVKVRMVFGR